MTFLTFPLLPYGLGVQSPCTRKKISEKESREILIDYEIIARLFLFGKP